MTNRLTLTRSYEWFLEKAYLLKPEGGFNLSSLAVLDEDIEAHNCFDSDGYSRLAKLGYIVGLEDRTWEVGDMSVDVLIFRLTPLGLSQAERLINERRTYTLGQRLAAISRSDWIALVALFVSVIALFQAAS